KRFLRYIKRLLKAGTMDNGNFIVSAEGVPQGSVCSPALANIFAHAVLDDWFEKVVKGHCKGKVSLFRYADDAVICCEHKYDADRIMDVIGKRMSRYKLKLNEEKTHMVRFDRSNRRESDTFDFLGFTFYMGLSKKGHAVTKIKSSGKKIRIKLKNVNEWCRKNRNKYRLRELWEKFCVKLRGHIQYYGISSNSQAVGNFKRKAICIFVKWLKRRSQRNTMTNEKFKKYMQIYPAPRVQVHHRLF
ncbi:MAG: reverse transcriptase/maturase family protein, partial [Proteobacteria bacterium]|nr:reverse transcriptase/maturase family protein [Pseudomonadota bacterium]